VLSESIAEMRNMQSHQDASMKTLQHSTRVAQLTIHATSFASSLVEAAMFSQAS